MLDQALRDVLGEHTKQAGSLVEPDYLRFDFTHFGQVTDEELAKVEQIVNDKIWAALPVSAIQTDQETGHKMGAIAVFTEKYGKIVRVVSIGDYSIEFDGGTHVKNSSELGLFKIVSETGIGAGTRRIEAVTSKEAFELLAGEEQTLKQVAAQVKAPKLADTPAKVSQLQADLKAEQQNRASLESRLAKQQAGAVFDQVDDVNGTTLIAQQIEVSGMDQLRQLADTWKTKQYSDVLVLGTVIGEKVNLLVAVSDDKVKAGIKAGDLIKAIAPKVGGGGGGRPTLAQAGGKKPAGLPAALKAAHEWLAEQ